MNVRIRNITQPRNCHAISCQIVRGIRIKNTVDKNDFHAVNRVEHRTFVVVKQCRLRCVGLRQ